MATADDELELAESFRSHCPELALYSLSRASPPEPDVVAVGEAATIGIELTRMRGLHRLSVRESEMAGVLRQASELVHRRTGARTAVRVDWSPGVIFTKAARSALAEKLAAFVASHLPSDEADVLFGPPGVAPSIPSDQSFASVYILRSDSAGECDWDTDFNWSGAVAEPPFVQAHIDRKSAKPRSYCGNYTQRWLLLIHEGFRPSSGYDLSPAVGRAEFVCSYDRAFIYTLVGGRVTELQIAKASRSAV